MKFVFMLEEPSMKEVLDSILPQVLPNDVQFRCIPHAGKSDLEKSLSIKLRAWKEPGVTFVILRDQDSANCHDVKARLKDICSEAGRPDCIIRIVCRELESWFLADLLAVEKGLNISGLSKLQNRAKFRDPDSKANASKMLKQLVPSYQKIAGARAIAPFLDLSNERSRSFFVFISSLRKVTNKH